MSLPRYPKYKDSGTPWLGEIPATWAVRRIKVLFEIRKRIAGVDGHDVLSITQGGIKVKDLESNDGQLSMDYSKYQFVEPGDFAMNHMDLLTGYVDISKTFGVTSPDYRVFSVRDHSACNGQYFLYLFQNAYRQQIFYAFGQGASQLGRWRLPTEQFDDFVLPFPSLREQSAIAAFLDSETAKIDALVEEQRRLIELLKEKRRAVISHAVTKGLNPNATMKDSGIEWLGKVPEHWSVAPVAYRYSVQLGKMLDSAKITGDNLRSYLRVIDVQWGAINIDDLPQMDFDEDAREKFRLISGDLLVNEGGSYPGRCAIWVSQADECYYQKALHRMRPHHPEQDTTRFLFYVMSWAANQGVFVAGGNEATIEHLPAEKLRRYRFAFPPVTEQLAIASLLDSETAKFEELASAATRAIDLLQERRTALISAAVTGKIDVRGMAKEQTA
jgi:type I restriction enzyme S subunit